MEEGCDEDIRDSYADILTGVGKLKDYRLKLHINKEVKPLAQQVRRLPFGLRDKVDLKLDDLLSKVIIEEVPDTPTSWISPLVVAPKPDGDIRVCVDMRRANEALIRECHPIPTILMGHRSFTPALEGFALKWSQVSIQITQIDIFRT